MRKYKLSIIIVSVIVLLDLVTKLAAYHYLPFETDVPLIAERVVLYLTVNEGSSGSQADYLTKDSVNKNLDLLVNAIVTVALISYFWIVRNLKVKKSFKVIGGFIFGIIVSIAIGIAKQDFVNLEFPDWGTSVFTKFCGLALYGSILAISENRYIRFFLLVTVSCGIGNLLSHFYYPYHVVDFIYVEGFYEWFKIGIFNISDLAFDIGIIGLVFSFILIQFRKKAKPKEA